MIKNKIPVAEPDLGGKEVEYVVDAIEKEGRVSNGKYVVRFENLASKYFKRKYAVSCSNGTIALDLALLALGVGSGNEVIVPTLTFGATAAAVLHVGATPLFVDSNLNNWNMDTDAVRQKITNKTKAIIPVDLYGQPCNYNALEKLCKENNLLLIEDAAEAHGAYYDGRPVGSFGAISCFSFFGNKILTTGEGGICLTDSEELFEKMKIIKNHGMPAAGDYTYEAVGHNFRLTNVQAAIGCAQFERFDKFLEKRKNNETLYRGYLKDNPKIKFQIPNAEAQPVNWLFSVLVEGEAEKLKEYLLSQGIETRRLFTPIHSQKPYLKFSPGQLFPNADYLYQHGLSLPSSVKLKEEEIKFICDKINRYLA